jgi:prepilin signal peptidase PulO-like enzyme (type II secretory pathway)
MGKPFGFEVVLLTLYYGIFFTVIGIIVLYDLRHKIIPQTPLYLFVGLGVLMMLYRVVITADFLTLLSPFIISVPLYLLYLVTKKKGIGLGDVFLFLGVGAFLGVEQTLIAFCIAVWAGAFVAIILQFLNRTRYHLKYELPFAPYIMLGMLVVLFTDISLTSFVDFFSFVS